MDRNKICESQKNKVLKKVEEAQSKGLSQILVSPILVENVDEIRREGISIKRICLEDDQLYNDLHMFDILYWKKPYQTEELGIETSPKYGERRVSAEEAELLIKLYEKGIL